MTSTDIFYVYQYLTDAGVPYYIGKGKKSRIHDNHGTLPLPPIERRVFVKENMSEKEAIQLEMQLIRKYGRKIDGGLLDNIKLNQWACTSGWHHSPETIEKIRKGNLGKVRTSEQKKNYQKPKTREHAEKIRQANLGRVNDGRNEKIAITKSLQKWYTNGITTIMTLPGTEPAGFVPGRKIRGN